MIRLKNAWLSLWQTLRGCLITLVMQLVALSLPIYFCGGLFHTETKGPFKNWMQVVDFEADGDQDVFAGNNAGNYKVWWNDGYGMFTLSKP